MTIGNCTYNLNALVIFGTLISLEVVLEALGIVGDVRPLRGIEVIDHAVVEGEEGGSGTNLSTHVANGGHTRAGEGLDTRAGVLNNSASTTLNGEDAGNLEDDIWDVTLRIEKRARVSSTHPWG